MQASGLMISGVCFVLIFLHFTCISSYYLHPNNSLEMNYLPKAASKLIQLNNLERD